MQFRTGLAPVNCTIVFLCRPSLKEDAPQKKGVLSYDFKPFFRGTFLSNGRVKMNGSIYRCVSQPWPKWQPVKVRRLVNLNLESEVQLNRGFHVRILNSLKPLCATVSNNFLVSNIASKKFNRIIIFNRWESLSTNPVQRWKKSGVEW